MAVSACSLAIAFSGTPAVANPLDALVSPQADGAEAQDLGYKRTYTIHADSAWLADGRVLSPAYITLTKGVITRISSREPQAQKTLLGSGPKPKIIKVDGTLAAGVVDAWSSVLPAEIRLDRRPLPFSKVADGLPIQVEGADPALAAAVAAQRSAGVSAAYIGRADGNLMRGLGVPAGFSAHDLPYLEGHEFLDLMVAGDALGVQRGITDLNTLFSEAVDYRDSVDEYQEKLETYEESLKKYQEELDKFVEEQKKEEGKEGDAKAEGNGEKEKKEKKRPKRPKRPNSPVSTTARNLVLDAIDGKIAVRVQVESAAGIRAAIALQEEHNLNMMLVGGGEAVQCRFELAAAGIGVVLDVNRVHTKSNGQSFIDQFQQLLDAEVDVALSSGGRNLGPMLLAYAGEMIAQGADADAVWAALTSTPARMLGMASNFGQINRGCSGSMILFGGNSPFDASASFQAHKPK
jgi:hypothetical protein